MTLQRYIKIVGAILLFCILPYCASAQNAEKTRKLFFWQKKERVEKVEDKVVEKPEKVQEKKLLSFFKFGKNKEAKRYREDNTGTVEVAPEQAVKTKVADVMESKQEDKKFWDKLKVWEKINFKIFKKGKNEGMIGGEMVVDSTKTKEYRAAMKQIKKENSHKHQYSVGTNLLNWAYFGTANLEFNASLNNHFSVFAGGKYNGFKFETKAYKEIFNNQITGYAGIKWWPWFVNTGWWVGIKGQYSDFSTAGIMSSYLKEGVAVGGGLSGGYTFMMGRRFNLDLGIGVWGGTYLEYSDYEKPESKPGMFVKLDNIIVSFTYFF